MNIFDATNLEKSIESIFEYVLDDLVRFRIDPNEKDKFDSWMNENKEIHPIMETLTREVIDWLENKTNAFFSKIPDKFWCHPVGHNVCFA